MRLCFLYFLCQYPQQPIIPILLLRDLSCLL